jgi:flagellar motor switch protein FliN/FliY
MAKHAPAERERAGKKETAEKQTAERQTAENHVPPSETDRPVEVQAAEFQQVDASPEGALNPRRLDLLLDLTLPVAIELGRTNMLIKDILDLQRGSVVEFDKLAGEPVDVLINGKKMAQGEVVVIEKHFGIRITSLVDPTERVRNLGK